MLREIRDGLTAWRQVAEARQLEAQELRLSLALESAILEGVLGND